MNFTAAGIRFACGTLLSGVLHLAYSSDPRLIFPVTENSQKPGSLWLNASKPYLTNAWFMNFVLQKNTDVGSDPVVIFPYLCKIGPRGISLSYTNAQYYSDPRYKNLVTAFYYQFANQINLGSQETMDKYGVASYHGLSVTLQWKNQQGQQMTIPLIQGSPYVSAVFANATPVLRSSYKWMAINQNTTTGDIAATDRLQLQLALDAKHIQTWIVYSEKPLAWNWQFKDGKSELVSKQTYTGWLRLVLQKDTSSELKNDEKTLDTYSHTIPLDYEQKYYRKQDGLAYSFSWITQNNLAPLILSLPHQRPKAVSDIKSAVSYMGIKGLMQGETKALWEIELGKHSIDFLEPKTLTPQQKQILQTALSEDAQQFLSAYFPNDGPYLVGKRLARAARLLLIANGLHANTIQQKLIKHLEQLLYQKMQGKSDWHFEYDTTWGGIIPSIDNYGARHYNDHHFHYGYWVYSVAVLAYLDPQWLERPVPTTSFTPKEWIELLIRDYANNDNQDAYFPVQRYQDDYVGHSWALGLFATEDGRNQESSSEAVNAYYAVALYAKVLKSKELYDWAEFLMAREMQSAQTYWQIDASRPIYSQIFSASNQVAVNLWSSKVDTYTYFVDCNKQYRCGLQYSYGIEMLPFTAISPQLLSQGWLKTAYPTLKNIINNEYGNITPAWRWILIKGMASILNNQDREYYFAKSIDSKPEEYDNGDSKTNTLYYLIDG